jgi:NAD dependent epimerase/dehydratase family enzyme
VVVKAGGVVLRYGGLYGPGATDDQVKLVRKRLYPLVGGGTGYFSWVHLDDAASATVLAVEQQAKGVSRCSPTPTRTQSGRRSWPTRCRVTPTSSHVGPLADAWAIAREAKQARPND